MKEDYEALLASLLPDPADEAYHLTKAEVVGYVKETLDDVSFEAAESHLEVCAECVQAVEDLRLAQTDRFMPATANLSGQEKYYGHQSQAGLFASFTGLSRPVQFAAFLLLACALTLTTLLLIRTRNGHPSQPAERERANQHNQNAPLADLPKDQPRLTAKDTTGDNAEPTAAPAAEAPDRADETSVAQDDLAGIENLSPALHRAIVSALTTQRLERPKVLAELNGTSGTLLSESDDGLPFRLLSPVGKVIQSSKPSFHWQPLARAASYVVTVVDDELNEVATSGPITTTQWRAPSPLKRGIIYSWQVTALKDGEQIVSPVMPAPQAKFKILDQTSDEELKRVKRAFPNYHLGLGVLYARAGLLDEAERELQAALRANPRSTAARKLLGSLRSIKR